MCGACMMGDAIEIVENLPPVTPKQRTGKWMKTGQSYINPNRFRNYCCSECGWELDEHIRIEPHYCPNCGAEMEEIEEKSCSNCLYYPNTAPCDSCDGYSNHNKWQTATKEGD